MSDLQRQLPKAHQVSRPVISRLLYQHDYSLKANVKTVEAHPAPNRNQQFEHIYQQRQQHQQSGVPVISVDTKKKELIGNFKNTGTIWTQKAEAVHVHDFPQDALAKAVPYGIYDVTYNQGDVYLGQSSDTPAFAVDNIAHWCQQVLPSRYPGATRLMIEADGGGSNSSRSRVFKQKIQEKIADQLGITVTVCHYPTGTSKWNPIEHRLFSEISKTWAGCPLRSLEEMAGYIQQTTTVSGLAVAAHRNTREYPIGVKVSNQVMENLKLIRHEVCPQWNYTLYPQREIPPD